MLCDGIIDRHQHHTLTVCCLTSSNRQQAPNGREWRASQACGRTTGLVSRANSTAPLCTHVCCTQHPVVCMLSQLFGRCPTVMPWNHGHVRILSMKMCSSGNNSAACLSPCIIPMVVTKDLSVLPWLPCRLAVVHDLLRGGAGSTAAGHDQGVPGQTQVHHYQVRVHDACQGPGEQSQAHCGQFLDPHNTAMHCRHIHWPGLLVAVGCVWSARCQVLACVFPVAGFGRKQFSWLLCRATFQKPTVLHAL